MDDKKKERVQKLKEMIEEKGFDETVEQVLVKFCARTGVSLDACRQYYRHLVETREIKEK